MEKQEFGPKIPKFLLLLLGLVILILIGEGVYYFRITGTKRREESSAVPKIENQPVSKEKATFPCPVPKENCQKAEEQGESLGFRLPSGTEIKAVVSGRARLLKSSSKDIVLELRDEAEQSFFYYFNSDEHLSAQKEVKEGEVLGKTGKATNLNSNYNLLMETVKNGKYLKPKELF